MEGGGRVVMMIMNTPDEMDEGGAEKLSVSPKAKRIASPRWSKHETLVMIEAKRKHELEIQQANSKGRALLTDVNKWDLVSASCRAVGIDRDGKMCRKRWFNLLTEFKKIRDWRKSSNRVDNFWDLSGDERREKKLPTVFDHEVYVAMESFTTGKPGLLPDCFESSGTRMHTTTTTTTTTTNNNNDDGLFSEIDQDGQPVAEDVQLDNGLFPPQSRAVVHANGNELRSPPEAPLLHPGMAAERSRNWKKRKTPEEGDGKDPYAAILESTSKSFQAALTESVQAQIKAHSRSVQAQIEAQKQEHELDRAQRKEQGDRLIGVLTALVDTLGKIADKL